jgi:uncharacterized protein
LFPSDPEDFSSTFWRRLDVPGHDACRLGRQNFGYRLRGAAVYRHPTGAACVSYCVDWDADWRTISGRVEGFIGARSLDYAVAREDALWFLNGCAKPGLNHLVDLDLSFTPATNLLQIMRVAIAENETVPLPAAWLDVEEGTLTELPQSYASTFWYRAPSVGYEGLLQLAPNGFILSYPNLWQAETMQ